jgi:dienelactone hydrolase
VNQRVTRAFVGLSFFFWLGTVSAIAESSDKAEKRVAELATFLREFDSTVIPAEVDSNLQPELAEPKRMLSRSIQIRRRKRNEQDVAEWRAISSREEWVQFRDERVERLRNSLGTFPDPPNDLNVNVTKTLKGDGFQVECLVFESRPGLFVTANLYRPAEARRKISGPKMPGILICPSHHNPKTQSELQDMGMTWARQGCVVLVMDNLGHGERRQHPFRSSSDFPDSFRASRQDYYFRYNVGIQLHLIGDSLIGWMVWDLMRGVDLLLEQPGIDSKRIILLGSVAGGGDPAAVTAAIDSRIAAAVPFNFGGPQPESAFPLPKDAELSFNYIGGGSWESTRNLRDSARGGFLPWVIVSSLAPRRLIYAHEFTWDREHDPVWKRLQQIYKWHNVPDRLSSANGFGRVTLSSKEASHCNNIGPHHRSQIHPAFEKWFGIPAPDPEYQKRFDSHELLCVDDVDTAANVALTPVHRVADRVARQRSLAVRRQLAGLTPDRKRETLTQVWGDALRQPEMPPLGGLEPASEKAGSIRILKALRGTDDGITVPYVVLFPGEVPESGVPLVVVVSQAGKAAVLKERSREVASLLDAGIAVALPDLRGTGESRPGTYRGRRSYATGLSSSELMLGGTLVGQRLHDLRCILGRLSHHSLIDGDRIAVWGESLAEVNPPNRRTAVPLGIDEEPAHSEPLGPTLALLAAAFEPDIDVVLARGGLVSIRSVLDSQFVYLPHDFVVPGALSAGDLCDLGSAIAPRPLRIEGAVTGLNQLATQEAVEKEWQPAKDSYAAEKASKSLELSAGTRSAVQWLIDSLLKK